MSNELNELKKEKSWLDLILYIVSFIIGLFRKKKEEEIINEELAEQQFSNQISELNNTYENNAENHKPPTNFQSSVDYLNEVNKSTKK